MIQRIGGTIKPKGINHEKHIVNLTIDIWEFMNIFAQQVVVLYG
jgi:hypothetical protein